MTTKGGATSGRSASLRLCYWSRRGGRDRGTEGSQASSGDGIVFIVLTDIVIAYQQTGRPDEARRAAEQLLAARPNFTVAAWLKTQFSLRDTAQVEADAAALRAAGVPTG